MSDTVTPEEIVKRMIGTTWVMKDPTRYGEPKRCVIKSATQPDGDSYDGGVNAEGACGCKMHANLKWFLRWYKPEAARA